MGRIALILLLFKRILIPLLMVSIIGFYSSFPLLVIFPYNVCFMAFSLFFAVFYLLVFAVLRDGPTLDPRSSGDGIRIPFNKILT